MAKGELETVRYLLVIKRKNEKLYLSDKNQSDKEEGESRRGGAL